MKLACLHTSPAHIETFNTLCAGQPDIHLTQRVEVDWLTEAISQGVSNELEQTVKAALEELASQADAVICTCSTLGPITETVSESKVFRIDQPLMAAASQQTPVLLVMCLESTLQPSCQLLEQQLKACGQDHRAYRTLMCRDAWPHFEAGAYEEFARTIANTVLDELANHPHTGCVVLAQASMRGAVDYLQAVSDNIPILSSPELAIAHARQVAQHRVQ